MTLVTITLSAIEGENFDPNCKGSLNIFDTSGKRHNFTFGQDGLKKLVILNATVEGCGCFRMHKFNKGRGDSMFMSSGDVFTKEDLDFIYIRSDVFTKEDLDFIYIRCVYKESCYPTKIDYIPSLEELWSFKDYAHEDQYSKIFGQNV